MGIFFSSLKQLLELENAGLFYLKFFATSWAK